jgi:hypothetical protein
LAAKSSGPPLRARANWNDWTKTENLAAASIELTPEDLREITGAAAQVEVQGERYPEAMERMTGL